MEDQVSYYDQGSVDPSEFRVSAARIMIEMMELVDSETMDEAEKEARMENLALDLRNKGVRHPIVIRFEDDDIDRKGLEAIEVLYNVSLNLKRFVDGHVEYHTILPELALRILDMRDMGRRHLRAEYMLYNDKDKAVKSCPVNEQFCDFYRFSCQEGKCWLVDNSIACER